MDNRLKREIISKLDEENYGYSLDLNLSSFELDTLRNIISNHWLTMITHFDPTLTNQFKALGIENYHKLSHLLPHEKLWHVTARVLPNNVTQKIRFMPFMQTLENIFGEFTLADEENVGYEEIRWRIVRPNTHSDVGPMHADRWFVDLGHGIDVKNCKRVKVWIAIYCEPGLSGLSIVPGSHKREWKFYGEKRQGIMKPQFDESQVNLPIVLPKTTPGQAIIFNDNLLHRGVVNQSKNTRVSLEFTMFVNELIWN